MKRITLFAFVLLALVGLVALPGSPQARADHCYTGSYVYSTGWTYYGACYHQGHSYAAGYWRWNGYAWEYRQYAEKIVVYTVSHDNALDKALLILDRYARIAERQAAAGGELPASKSAFADGRQVLAGRCVACHAPGVAADKGKGFEIDPAAMSKNDLRAIVARVTSADPAKRMPPTGALPAAEVELVKRLVLPQAAAAE